MDTEFINEYIGRLIANVHDLTSKNIMLETRLAMADKIIANLEKQLADSKVVEETKTTKKPSV